MAILTSSGVTFGNGSTQSIASAINSTADVFTATATATYGAVGSYTNIAYQGGSGSVPSNSTIAGSGLQRYDYAAGSGSSAGLGGTWRNVGANNLNGTFFGGTTVNNLLVRVS
jgi:hypothetical protein